MDTRPEMRRVNLGAEWVSIGYVEAHRVGVLMGMVRVGVRTDRARRAMHARNLGSEAWESVIDVSTVQLLFRNIDHLPLHRRRVRK